MRILITGGCGFIGHHYVDYLLNHTDWEIIVVDCLTYAANGYDRLREIGALGHSRVRVFPLDFSHGFGPGIRREFGEVDYLVHMGAHSHVARSIADPLSFVTANVVGTTQILEFAKTQNSLKKMVYFSTDEVFGSAGPGVAFNEWDRYNSGNPYAASKAGGEEMCLAYANTYGTPVAITHTMNVMGTRQHPEKFVPLVVRKLLKGELVYIHCDEAMRPCSRCYIHVQNVCDAVQTVLLHGDAREKYNIASSEEVNNLSLAEMIATIAGYPLRHKLVAMPSERPGNDHRYCLNNRKLTELGWPKNSGWYVHFENGLRDTVEWMVNNPESLGLCRTSCSGQCSHLCSA